jgi:hypothetical protein
MNNIDGTNIVHMYLLAEQEGLQKKLFVMNTATLFFVKKKEQIVGDADLFSTTDVVALLDFVRNYG